MSAAGGPAVRVDRWLWGVRVYKTRTQATDACAAGHVRVDGAPAKPATPVRVGSQVEARVGTRSRLLEVAALVDKRVGAPKAAECVIDQSPPPPPREEAVVVFERERGAGRPTKRDRRRLDRHRGR